MKIVSRDQLVVGRRYIIADISADSNLHHYRYGFVGRECVLESVSDIGATGVSPYYFVTVRFPETPVWLESSTPTPVRINSVGSSSIQCRSMMLAELEDPYPEDPEYDAYDQE